MSPRPILLAIALLLVPAAALAGNGPPLTLDESVSVALKANHGLLASSERLDAASAARAGASSAFLPRIDISETFLRSDNPVMAFGSKLDQGRFTAADFAVNRLNSPSPVDNFNFRVQLTQPVFNGGKEIVGLKRAGLVRNAAQKAYERARQEVVSETVRAYNGVALAEGYLRVAEAALKDTDEHVGLARKFLDQGVVIGSELLLAKVRLAETKEMAIKAGNSVSTARAALNMLMARPQDTEFTIASPMETPDFMGTLPELQAEALKSRPDLSGIDYDVSNMAEGVRLARTDYLPNLNLVARFDKDTNEFIGGGGDSYTLMGVLSWNVFDGLRTTHAVREARARLNEAGQQRERMREAVLFEVRRAYGYLDEARQRIAAAAGSVEEAEEGLRILRARFRSGLAKTTDVLDAETALTRARTNRLQAVYDYNVSLAELRLAVGRPMGN